MFKFCVLFLAMFVCNIKCAPTEAVSQTFASQKTLHLHMNNSTNATNYHLTPIMNELGQVDDEVNKELEAILPYINFLFDIFNLGSEVQNDECLDDMVIQLVPDHNAKDDKNATVKPTE